MFVYYCFPAKKPAKRDNSFTLQGMYLIKNCIIFSKILWCQWNHVLCGIFTATNTTESNAVVLEGPGILVYIQWFFHWSCYIKVIFVLSVNGYEI